MFAGGRQAHVPLLVGFDSCEIQWQLALLPLAPAYKAKIVRGCGDLAPAFLRPYPATEIAESMRATVRDAVYG